ncbi:MAG: glycerol kinase GlpK [Pseudomonadota bacterium]
MTRLLLAIDQGTTSSTAMVIDENLAVLGKATEELPQIFPQPAWVEHDPEAIWKSVLESVERALDSASVSATAISAIGLTNQRETTLLWDRRSGEPARTAIVWQDRRTAEMCEALRRNGHEQRVRELTGLVIDPYFSATKLRWMLDSDLRLAARAADGSLAFGTVDSYLLFRMTGGTAHLTDPSNASRTLLFGLRSLQWEDELCRLFGVPPACLPEVRSSAEIYGTTKGVPCLPDGIPIAGIAGDQQAALFGQCCFSPGDAKCTFGTGAFLLLNTGSTPVPSSHGLVSTVGWKLGAGIEAGETVYALEGSAFVAGAAVQWLRDGLGIIQSAAQVEDMARSVPDTGGVVLVPAFAGLGAPLWRPAARAAIVGLTRGTTKNHIARAALEGIALQNHDLLRAMEEDSGQHIASLKVDGGAAANDLLMQIQADLLGVTIARPEIIETTALGAACLAGIGAGLWRSKAEIARAWRQGKQFVPRASREWISSRLASWKAALNAVDAASC